jgi:hypothetical protein
MSPLFIMVVQDDCVAALRNGTVDAFLQHYILNAYYTTIQPCDLTLVDIGFMVGGAGGPGSRVGKNPQLN